MLNDADELKIRLKAAIKIILCIPFIKKSPKAWFIFLLYCNFAITMPKEIKNLRITYFTTVTREYENSSILNFNN